MVCNKFLIVFVISAIDPVYTKCRFFRTGVSSFYQKIILDKHNYLRFLIVNGTVPGQPNAFNLTPLRYDRELAYAAQLAANTCKFYHYYPQDFRWDSIGQNIALGGASFVNSEPEWDKVIQTWFNEYKMYKYPNRADASTMHYAQIASADTKYIGCGYSYFFDNKYRLPSFVKLYVCNYGPRGNIKNKAPYESIYFNFYNPSKKCSRKL